MKRFWKYSVPVLIFFCMVFLMPAKVQAQGTDETAVIEKGIYAGSIDLSGATAAQAKQKIEDYITALQSASITLNAVNSNAVTVTAADLGLSWANPEIVDEAAGLGKEGNIVQRYKQLKDLQNTNKVYPI